MTRYVGKIRELLAKMFALRLKVLPVNRGSVNKYLDSVYSGITTLHSGLNPCYVNEGLQDKFNSYVDSEEARLRGNLEAISYDIDALNTLFLVTGQGRIERVSLVVSVRTINLIDTVPVTPALSATRAGFSNHQGVPNQNHPSRRTLGQRFNHRICRGGSERKSGFA